MSIASILVGALASPLTSSIVEIVKDYNGKKINEKEIEATVKQAIITASASLAKEQAGIISKELDGKDLISRIWRPVVVLTCTSVLMAYAIIFPVMVAWFGFAPVKVGDQLLSWIFTLVSMGLGGYLGSTAIENITKGLRK